MNLNLSQKIIHDSQHYLRAVIGVDSDQIVSELWNAFEVAKKNESSFLPSEWDTPIVAQLVNPVIESCRRVIKSRNLPLVEMTELGVYDHSYPVFIYQNSNVPLALVADRCSECFKIPMVFDPAGLILSNAEALHVYESFISISLVEFLLNRPFASVAHEIYHVASHIVDPFFKNSPNWFSYEVFNNDFLGYQLTNATGSEAFASIFAGCYSVDLANKEINPIVKSFLLRDALNCFREGVADCLSFNDMLLAGIIITLPEIEYLANNGALAVDSSNLDSLGTLKIGLPVEGSTVLSSPMIRIFLSEIDQLITIQLTSDNREWRSISTLNLAKIELDVSAIKESLKSTESHSAYAIFNNESIKKIFREFKDQVNSFNEKIARANVVCLEMDTFVRRMLQGRSFSNLEFAAILESAQDFYPEIQNASRKILLG